MERTALRVAAVSLFVLVWAVILVYRGGKKTEPPIAVGSAYNHTVSLLMVKNEGRIIERTLESLYAHVGRYVFLCDTGSTDDTVSRALDATPPGTELIMHTLSAGFTHFEQARNECKQALSKHALDARRPGRIEWVALPDADFVAARPTDEQQQSNAPPAYDVNTIQMFPAQAGQAHNSLPLLVRASTFFEHCRYRLWTHEFLDCSSTDEAEVTYGYYNGFHFVDHEDGSSRTSKLTRDVKLLRDWLARVNETELRPRALYYLARAYEDQGQASMALLTYARHNREQTHTNYQWLAHYRMALILHKDWSARCNANVTACVPEFGAVREAFMRAYYTYDGYFRREPFYLLALSYRRLGLYHQCLLYAGAGLSLPPIDHARVPLSLEPWAHGDGLRAEHEFCVTQLKPLAVAT